MSRLIEMRWAKNGPNKPFIVVADAYPTRTTELADVVLPAAMWSEKEGVFGMSERRYQFLPKIVKPVGEVAFGLRHPARLGRTTGKSGRGSRRLHRRKALEARRGLGRDARSVSRHGV